MKQQPRVVLKPRKPEPWTPPVKPKVESSKGLVTRTYGLDESVYGVKQEPRGPYKPASMSYEWKTKRGWHRRKHD